LPYLKTYATCPFFLRPFVYNLCSCRLWPKMPMDLDSEYVSSCFSSSDGSKKFDLGWVSHLWFGYGFGKFPLKMSNFSIFLPFGSKKNVIGSGWKVPRVRARSAFYLLQVKSMFGSGQGPSLLSSDHSMEKLLKKHLILNGQGFYLNQRLIPSIPVLGL